MKRYIFIIKRYAFITAMSIMSLPALLTASTAAAQTEDAAVAAQTVQQEQELQAAESESAESDSAEAVAADTTDTADTAESIWEAANAAYVNGAYRRAAEGYESLLARGLQSAQLYYNLGNACFKAGRIGPAIVNYRRALRLSPGNDDIRYNLEVAAENTKDSIESMPEFFLTAWSRAVRHTMSSTAWCVLSLVSLAAALALALVYLLASRIGARKAGFYGMTAALFIFVVATSFAAAGRREMVQRNEAVVMSSSVSVKSSPDNSATDLFVLHEGTEVRVTNRLDDWCEIVIADGKKGWVRCRQIEVI